MLVDLQRGHHDSLGSKSSSTRYVSTYAVICSIVLDPPNIVRINNITKDTTTQTSWGSTSRVERRVRELKVQAFWHCLSWRRHRST